MTTPTLSEQLAAVEITLVNLKGHVANLHGLVAQRKRPQHDLDLMTGRLPAIEQAVVTLAYLARNADRWKEFIGKEAA